MTEVLIESFNDRGKKGFRVLGGEGEVCASLNYSHRRGSKRSKLEGVFVSKDRAGLGKDLLKRYVSEIGEGIIVEMVVSNANTLMQIKDKGLFQRLEDSGRDRINFKDPGFLTSLPLVRALRTCSIQTTNLRIQQFPNLSPEERFCVTLLGVTTSNAKN